MSLELEIKSEFATGLRKLNKDLSKTEFSKKMEFVTGIPPDAQKYYIDGVNGNKSELIWESGSIENLNLKHGDSLYITDSRDKSEQLVLDDDHHFELSNEAYERRSGGLLEWKRKQLEQRVAKDREFKVPTDKLDMELGSPCFVKLSSGDEYRGTVEFIGDISVLPHGQWVGVNLLTPDGKNDGSVKGVKLFNALPNHGVVVRPSCVRPLDTTEEEL